MKNELTPHQIAIIDRQTEAVRKLITKYVHGMEEVRDKLKSNRIGFSIRFDMDFSKPTTILETTINYNTRVSETEKDEIEDPNQIPMFDSAPKVEEAKRKRGKEAV